MAEVDWSPGERLGLMNPVEEVTLLRAEGRVLYLAEPTTREHFSEHFDYTEESGEQSPSGTKRKEKERREKQEACQEQVCYESSRLQTDGRTRGKNGDST